MQWPINEIEMLRTNPVHLPSQDLKGGSVLEVPSVTAAQASHCNSEIGFLLIVINQTILHPLSRLLMLICCPNYIAYLYLFIYLFIHLNRQMWRLHLSYQILEKLKC